MQTQIPVGHPTARKLFSIALFAQFQQSGELGRILRGPMPDQSDAESKIKMQSSADMPVVMSTDLSKTAGDIVSVDCYNIIGGKPLVGDLNAEGRGEKLSSSTMEIRIDLLTKVVDAGGRMAQQRTVHQLRGIARSQLVGYYKKLDTQMTLVHMAGARGSQTGIDWLVPLQSDADFTSIMMNTVKAPSYNRHYVANGAAITQGALQLQSIASTDLFKLEHLDSLRTLLDDMQFPMQPVRIADDPAKDDSPLYVLLVTARQWNSILTNTSGAVWRTFLQNAWNRKNYGSKHPLFNGEPGLWNRILVQKIDRFAIRFQPGEVVKGVLVANRLTGTESDVTVNGSLGAGFGVDRALLLGAQALGFCLGKNARSEYYFSYMERMYNFERNLEVAGDCMKGKAKIQFKYPDGLGNDEPTDHGVLILDTAVKL